jgi:hypothetical protein
MSTDNLSPATRQLIEQVEAALPSQQTPEFTRLREGIFELQVCTSLPDAEAVARVNEMPVGTTHGWQLGDRESQAPVACSMYPDTHRHLIFEC